MASTTATEPSARAIPFGRPWITDDDRAAVLRVLEGHVLTHGPECSAFEQEFAAFLGPDARAVTTSSCMASLHLAYLHLGVGPGDEVIVPAQTHVATAHAVEWVGARPVFVDCDPATGNLTAERIEAALTPATRAISVVHFLGIPCGMDEIARLARERGLFLVEDCALAVGSRFDGRHVGLFGDAGTFSFYPVKHLTSGEGGCS
ncbi:MAG: DegT/DnrJ/EryC1/StrS aminotransferase family protein [Thermoleophilia bacterium]